jgi:hypothetical protein
MDTAQRTYVHQYVSDALGEGARVSSAVVTATKTGTDAAAVVVTLTNPSNMTEAELTDAQAFIDLVDEEATALVDLCDATWPPA